MHCMVVNAQLRLCISSYLCFSNVLDMMESWLQHMPIATPHVLMLTYAWGLFLGEEWFQLSELIHA